MFKLLLSSLLCLSAWAQSPAPKHYDPATLQSMQSSITKLSTDLSAFRSEITTSQARTIGQLTQRVNGLALDLHALRDEVGSLDVTQNSDRLTRLEDRTKQEDAERIKRDAASKSEFDAMMAFLKWIGGALGVLLINVAGAHFRKNSRDKTVDKALQDVKADTTEIQKQTNGMNRRLQAENDALRAQARNDPA
jgi:hypothetical protein